MEKKKTGPTEKWAFRWFLKFCRVRWPNCCWYSVPWYWTGDCKCMIIKVGLWTWNHGDRCVLLNGVDNEQCLQRLIGRAQWDNLGAVPWTALKTRRQSLYPTCSGTRSQWRLSRSKPDTGVSHPEWKTSCAAAFITRWSDSEHALNCLPTGQLCHAKTFKPLITRTIKYRNSFIPYCLSNFD